MNARAMQSVSQSEPVATDDPLFKQLLNRASAPTTESTRLDGPGLRICELIALAEDGTPLVRSAGSPRALAAMTLVDVRIEHIGMQAAIMFEAGNENRPIIVGLLRSAATSATIAKAHPEVNADGESLTVMAKEQLVFRCGKASITLTKSGKVLIEGTYLLSRASGVNRIKGGSVQLN